MRNDGLFPKIEWITRHEKMHAARKRRAKFLVEDRLDLTVEDRLDLTVETAERRLCLPCRRFVL